MKCFHILLTNLWKCLEKIFVLLQSESKNYFHKNKDSLWRVKNWMCLVLLHVEMRAKTVRQVKIYFFCTPFLPPKLLTKSTLTRTIFWISSESKIGSKPEKVTGYSLTTLTATINQSNDIGILLIINCLFSSFVDFYHMKC